MNETKPLEILLVEDNPGDVVLAEIFFEEEGIFCNLQVATDGEMASEILHGEGRYGHSHKPDIVFLDINLPKRDGRQILHEMKTTPELRDLPVAILSSSKIDVDLIEVFQLHPDCYVIKPLDLNNFSRTIAAYQQLSFSIDDMR